MHNLLSFPDESRVWIYQGNKTIPQEDVGRVNAQLIDFAEQWTSHNIMLKATAGLLHDRFVVLVVNQDVAGASGCSIDASVRYVKALGDQYGIDFMDRQLLTYLTPEDEVREVHMHGLSDLYTTGEVRDDTLFFDNLVQNKDDFLGRWLVPLEDGWMKRFI